MGSATRRNDEIVIGIIGLGSIGTRHALKLKELGIKKIVCLRTKSGTRQEVEDTLRDVVSVCTNETAFRNAKPDALIIANPTALHATTLAHYSDLRIPVFIEKPMVSEGSEFSLLQTIDPELVMVGYCLRFHPIIQTVKQMLDEAVAGKIFLTRLRAGHYLPQWHPYADYRQEYYSRQDLGGGALRTLSHELDLMVHFFGTPQAFDGIAAKISDLSINVDDYVSIRAEYPFMRVDIELDFLSLESTRQGTCYGTNGEIQFDFKEQAIWFTDRKTMEKKSVNFDKSVDMYLEQMRHFLDFVQCRKQGLFCTFDQASTIATLIDKTKQQPPHV